MAAHRQRELVSTPGFLVFLPVDFDRRLKEESGGPFPATRPARPRGSKRTRLSESRTTRPERELDFRDRCIRLDCRECKKTPGNLGQRDGNLNTHSVVPPAGLSISGVKLAEPELSGPPPPDTTATNCSPWTL
jgi:hypothetical protein